jgi:drug/metabolite transporter (DMT)-like permease
MLFLAGSIVLTSYLILSFKVLERMGIPVLQAIIFNYFACVITGSVVSGSFPIHAEAMKQPWFPWAILTGTMLIIMLNIIGICTQKIGISVTTVANKLSLVIPFIVSIFLYNEAAGALKITGLIIALIAVVCTSYSPQKNQDGKSTPLLLLVMLPAILFFGSGILDSIIKYVETTYLNAGNNDAFLITCFFTAAVLGSLMLIYKIVAGSEKFDVRSIPAGILIGIPNYFSIWCLIHVLKKHTGNSSAIIPINNMGIVLLCTLTAALLFSEKLSKLNLAGIALAIISIALISFG